MPQNVDPVIRLEHLCMHNEYLCAGFYGNYLLRNVPKALISCLNYMRNVCFYCRQSPHPFMKSAFQSAYYRIHISYVPGLYV